MDEITALVKSGINTNADLSTRLSVPHKTMRHRCIKLVKLGELFEALDFVMVGGKFTREVTRYFTTEAERDTFAASFDLAQKAKEAKKKNGQERAKRKRERSRKSYVPKPRVQTAKVVPKPAAPRKTPLYHKGGALLDGEPIIDERTKQPPLVPFVDRRFKPDGPVIGGFRTQRIGEYDMPASRWVEAVA